MTHEDKRMYTLTHVTSVVAVAKRYGGRMVFYKYFIGDLNVTSQLRTLGKHKLIRMFPTWHLTDKGKMKSINAMYEALYDSRG